MHPSRMCTANFNGRLYLGLPLGPGGGLPQGLGEDVPLCVGDVCLWGVFTTYPLSPHTPVDRQSRVKT